MHRTFSILLAFCLSATLSLSAVAQDVGHEVRGTVVDAEGQAPLPGVNVQVKGTTSGTATSALGEYEVVATSPNDTLVFSYLGFATQEIPISGRSQIDVAMTEDVRGMDEVIVVGYGTQRKSTITGSISSMNLEDVTPLATHRTDQMLQGRASGLLVRNTDSAPGGETVIRIRGMNSILGDNDALVVIDGLQGGDLTALNPQDVSSIEVLKGASATAIYGSEGANGVILITTKRGLAGKPTISYSSEVTSASLAKKLDLLDAADYARNINALEMANNVGRDPQPVFSEDEIGAFEQNGGTDWQDVMYGTALTHNHQLSVRGGTPDINYYLSGGYLNQEGILRNSGYDRITLRANLRADVAEWLGVDLSWAGSKEADHSPPYGSQVDWPNNPVGGALQFPPTLPPVNEDGTYSVIPNEYGPSVLWNPLASAEEPLLENSEFNNDISGGLNITPLENVTLEIRGGASFTRNDELEYWNLNTFNGRQNGGQGVNFNANNNYYQYQNILRYENDFGRHTLSAMGATELKYTEYYSSEISNTSFVNHETGVYDLGGSEIQNTSSFYSERTIQSALGRINYDFDNRYLLTATFRTDGSSVFGANNKWSSFPAASVGWRVSDESFMQSAGFINNLMLRASWGKSGNQAISPYQTLAQISQSGNYPWSGGETITRGFNITRAANPLLRWETTTQTNIGVDLLMFSGLLGITAEYYQKTTDELLMQRELPRTTGLSSIIDNVGTMENSGFEVSLESTGASGDFEWDAGLNFTRFTTTVADLGEVDELVFHAGGSGAGTSVPFMYLREGEEFGQMVGWGYEGVWSTSEAEEAARYGQLPGDPHYTDVNNDGRIDNDDQMVIGQSIPDFILGMTSRLAYKNFSLDLLVEGTFGNDIFNVARINRVSGGTSTELLNRWTPDNQDSDVPAIIDAQTREEANLVSTITFPAGASNQTSRWVEDGSYLRLKNVTLSYYLPPSMASAIKATRARIYVGATNLLTFTDYSGFDPEVSSYTGNDAQLGTDFNSYPPARMFNVGVNLSF